jgi:hypothetical protein
VEAVARRVAKLLQVSDICHEGVLPIAIAQDQEKPGIPKHTVADWDQAHALLKRILYQVDDLMSRFRVPVSSTFGLFTPMMLLARIRQR